MSISKYSQKVIRRHFYYREKWTLFDESTHVPLLIAHPLSPFKGQRYTKPVELIDIFPTINDLLAAPYNKRQLYGADPNNGHSRKFVQLQGKSLAPIILGRGFRYRHGKTNSKIIYHGDQMPSLNQSYAISQMWQCASNETAAHDPRDQNPKNAKKFLPMWAPCDLIARNSEEVSVMGYSMRTVDFRYTQYIPFVRPQRLPNFSAPIFTEELYDHRNDKPGDLGHQELINFATDVAYKSIMENFRKEMKSFLWNDVVYLNMTTSFAGGGLHRKNTGGNAMSNK